LNESGVAARMAFDTGGNVGIGETSPGDKLHVTSTAAGGITVETSSASNAHINVANTSTGVAAINLDASDGDFAGADYFSIRQNNDLSAHIFTQASAGDISIDAGASGGEGQLYLDTGGNVGIGTTSPGAVLDVFGGGNNIQMSRAGFDPMLMGVGTANGQNGFQLSNNQDLNIPFTINESAPNASFVMDSSGNVGIGTAAPSTLLSLYKQGLGTIGPELYLQNTSDESLGSNTGITFGLTNQASNYRKGGIFYTVPSDYVSHGRGDIVFAQNNSATTTATQARNATTWVQNQDTARVILGGSANNR